MAQQAPRRAAARLSVLVIDDDRDVREFLQDFLGAEGFEVTPLADPSSALAWLRKATFQLIMLDVMMPKVYGLDLLPQIRAVDDHIPVIIMISDASPENASESIRLGASGYVFHPLPVVELREMIARIASRKA